MKTKTWILLLAALLVLCVCASVWLLRPQVGMDRAEVWSEGELLCTLDLGVDRVLTVKTSRGTNVITVKDGTVAVTEADCPDHYCMDRGFCSGGTQIVCLPNRLVIRFVGGQEVDGVAG